MSLKYTCPSCGTPLGCLLYTSEIHKQMLDRGTGTKSQQALKLQQEQRKQQRKSKSREDKLAEEKKMFDLKRKKKKEKHRGH